VAAEVAQIKALLEKKQAEIEQKTAEALNKYEVAEAEKASLNTDLQAMFANLTRVQASLDTSLVETNVSKQLAAEKAAEAKRARETLQELVLKSQQSTRRAVAAQMESVLEKYYDRLADKVYSRLKAEGHLKAESSEQNAVNSELPEGGEQKAEGHLKMVNSWPEAEDLFEPGDAEELKEILRSFYMQVIQESWDTWGLVAGGLYTPFDPEDPAVTRVLEKAGGRVRMIDETTLLALRTVMKHGSEQGWSIDHLVRGDAENGIPGLKDVIEQTYKNRARAIARTELGTAQNLAAAARYASAGVKNVVVLDDGFDNSHPCCKQLNGAVVPLAWAEEHPLQHPNCVRAYAPEFDRTPTADDLRRADRADKEACE